MNAWHLTCSFCGKTDDQVETMIGGPIGVAICDECVALCVAILDERTKPHGGKGPARWEARTLTAEWPAR